MPLLMSAERSLSRNTLRADPATNSVGGTSVSSLVFPLRRKRHLLHPVEALRWAFRHSDRGDRVQHRLVETFVARALDDFSTSQPAVAHHLELRLGAEVFVQPGNRIQLL